jgi:hypothetical protein
LSVDAPIGGNLGRNQEYHIHKDGNKVSITGSKDVDDRT